jgi:hypothetical protein
MATDLYCKDCGSTAGTKKHMPGSIFIELVLWCCFVVPGLSYTIWRYHSSGRICRACASANLIPSDSPIAIQNISIKKQA